MHLNHCDDDDDDGNYDDDRQKNGKKNDRRSSLTHRPIARSIRHMSMKSASSMSNNNTSGVPSGHRYPILGVHWYPGDVYGSFVSTSISGKVLVWVKS